MRMVCKKTTLSLLVLPLFGLFLHGVATAAQPLGCLLEPDRVAEVGSPVVGIVGAVNVERGATVRKGQVLATLRSDVERASVDIAKTRSQAEADVRTAEANLKLAKVTQQRGEELVLKKFISQQALDKSIAETAIAEQKLKLAREQLDVWNSELGLARAQLGQRSIRSPIDGIIAERYIWPGERVEEKALFKVAKISPLRVEMVLPATLYGTLSKDMIINVTPELPGSEPLEAKVTLVDRLIDGASNTFRVRAEIPNEDMLLPAGVRCKAELPDPPSVTANKSSDPFSEPPPSGTLKLTPKAAPVSTATGTKRTPSTTK